MYSQTFHVHNVSTKEASHLNFVLNHIFFALWAKYKCNGGGDGGGGGGGCDIFYHLFKTLKH